MPLSPPTLTTAIDLTIQRDIPALKASLEETQRHRNDAMAQLEAKRNHLEETQQQRAKEAMDCHAELLQRLSNKRREMESLRSRQNAMARRNKQQVDVLEKVTKELEGQSALAEQHMKSVSNSQP